MKTGMNLLLWTPHVTADHFGVLQDLKNTGYDTVEIPIFEGAPDHYAMLGAELDRLGLERSVVSVIGPSDKNPVSPDKAAATRVWRDFFPSRDSVYTEGLAQMKDGWAKAK